MADLQSIVIAHLPYLRRYARALTGAQAQGDRAIRQCLEALAREPAAVLKSDSPRRELYRFFHRHCAAALPPPKADQGDALAKRLTELPPLHRQLLLLTTVEDFNPRDAAYIADVAPAAVPAALEQARDELKRQAPTTVLIIEDEPVIALSLSDIAEQAGHTVVGVAATKAEAVEQAGETRPGLVLVDIHLRDGSSGIDAVQEILHAMSVPVIFITAFPERLLTGERPEPTFLVTKPFNLNTVMTTMSQALLTRRD